MVDDQPQVLEHAPEQPERSASDEAAVQEHVPELEHVPIQEIEESPASDHSSAPSVGMPTARGYLGTGRLHRTFPLADHIELCFQNQRMRYRWPPAIAPSQSFCHRD